LSFIKNALSVLATSAVVAPISLLTSVVLARWLGADTLGSYSVIVNFATVGVMLATLGWPSATVYRLRRSKTDPAQVAASGIATMSAVSLLVLAGGVALQTPITSMLLGGAPITAYRIGLGLVVVQLFGRLFVALARGLDRFDLANRYLFAVALGALVTFVVVFGSGETSLLAAISSFCAVHLMATVGLGVAVLRLTSLRAFPSIVEIGVSLRYGIKSYLQSMAGQVHEQVDILMLAGFAVEPASIAYYAIAVGVVNRLKIVPESLSVALFPHVASLDSRAASVIAARTARHSFTWVVFIAASLAFASPWPIPLISGEPFAESVTPILILLPGAAMLTTYSVLARYFMAVNRQEVTLRTQLVATTANVALNAILIPQFGIRGAAASSLISYGFEMCLIVIAFRRESGLGLGDTLIFRVSDFEPYATRFRRLSGRNDSSRG